MRETYTSACKYCGQIITFEFESDEKLSEKERIKEATKRCNCDESIEFRVQEEKKEKALNNIETLFGYMAEEKDRISENIVEILKMLAEQICERKLKKASIEITSGTKAVISRTTKGEIKISREEKKKQEITQ